MKNNDKAKAILVGIFIFCLPPAFVVGLLVLLASGSWPVAVIVFAAAFGFGLDMCFGKGCQ